MSSRPPAALAVAVDVRRAVYNQAQPDALLALRDQWVVSDSIPQLPQLDPGCAGGCAHDEDVRNSG